jgi:hypothetical protein
MLREPDGPNLTRRAVIAPIVQGANPRVVQILGEEDPQRLLLLVAAEDLSHLEHGEWTAAAAGERHGVGAPHPFHVLVREGERHGDGPGQSVGQMHRLQDRVVVLLSLEPGERGERAHRKHLQVRELTFADVELRVVTGLCGQLLGLRARREQVDQRPAVRRDGLVRGHGSAFLGTSVPDERA